MTIICCICKEEKTTDNFYPRKDRKPGQYHRQCRACRLSISRANKGWFAKNYLKNHEKNKAARRRYAKNNLPRFAEIKKRYLSRKKAATPAWLSDGDKIEIRWAYAIAREITKTTGTRHEVDHIVPLGGLFVCGLHVPWNLQVIPSLLNKKKGYGCPEYT